MRGCGHRDIEATRRRGFSHKDSYVSAVTTKDGRPKEFLRGDDWKRRRHECFQRDEFRCVDCGAKHYLIDPHHIIERSDGGDDHLSNLETNCRPCHNTKKGQVQLKSIPL